MFDGLPRHQPMTPQPQDWEKLASRGGEPYLVGTDRTVLDSLPVLFPRNGNAPDARYER